MNLQSKAEQFRTLAANSVSIFCFVFVDESLLIYQILSPLLCTDVRVLVCLFVKDDLGLPKEKSGSRCPLGILRDKSGSRSPLEQIRIPISFPSGNFGLA